MKAVESIVPNRDDRSIGAILVETGRLQPQDAERILQLQHKERLRFGDAAIRLGLLSAADIEFAVSRQFDNTYLRSGESGISDKIITAYAATGTQAEAEALRALRGQLLLRWFDGNPSRKSLAIVSSVQKEGRSFIAANLAVVFAQLGKRTLLVDADMRNPVQHELFGIDNRVGLSALLSTRAGLEAIQRVPSLPNLSVLTAGTTPPNPLELLTRPIFQQLLEELAEGFDVVLLDTPSTSLVTDANTVAARVGAVLIVVRKNTTKVRQVHGVFEAVSQVGATVVGTILNDF